MSCPLPLKIQIKVLGHLSPSSLDYIDGGYVRGSQTLLSCCLVRKDWRRVCQRKLLSAVFIWNHRELNRLVASFSSAAHPIGTYVTYLSLDEDVSHVAPFYLAQKLSCLRHLDISSYHRGPFVVRSSLAMHIKHFRTVTELSLNRVTFQSSWDFCRLIVGLSALSTLRLKHVDLLDSNPLRRHDGSESVLSLFTFPRDLTYLHVTPSSNLNPLWMWATPSQIRHREPANPRFRPFLTRCNADGIWEFVEYLFHYGRYIGNTFKWSFDEDHQQCEHDLLVCCRVILKLATF